MAISYLIPTKRDTVLWCNRQITVLIFILFIGSTNEEKYNTNINKLNIKCTLFYTFIWSHKNHVFTILLTILRPHALTLPGKSLLEIGQS